MAEATQTTTEFNVKRPDGTMGAGWNTSLPESQRKAGEIVAALRSNGAVGQTVEIVSRVKTVTYSEESHHSFYKTETE